MAVIQEVIKASSNGSISFGDYSVKEKKKVNDFEIEGNVYNVKTHKEITRIEKNGSLLLETVPGAAIHDLNVTEEVITFEIEGFGDTQVTMELEYEKEYRIFIKGVAVGQMESTKSGKINFSVEAGESPQPVKLEKR